MPKATDPMKGASILRDVNGHYLKGQTGNPVGRPKKGHAMAEKLRHYLAMPVEEVKKINIDEAIAQNLDAADVVALRIIRGAINGEAKATKLLMNYIEGMPAQQMVQSGGAAAAIAVVFPAEKFDGA